MTDPALRDFIETRSPAAFRALVERYGGAVYAQCVRQLRDVHLAEDVSQAVFVVLFQKARNLPRDVMLPAWLFQVTRYACANARRGELRRRRHEHQAALMRDDARNAMDSHRAATDVELSLDDVIARLGRADREAIILRYYGGMDCDAVAAGLGVSVEAARRRLSRAVAKLREILSRRGVVIPSVVLLQQLDRIGSVTTPDGMASGVASSVAGNRELVAWSDPIARGAMRMLRFAQLRFAALVGSALVATSIIVVTLGAAALGEHGASAPANAAVAPGDPARQAIRVNLDALARAIRTHDLEAVRQLTSVAPNAQGELAHAMLAENVAYRCLQDAWAAKLKGPLELHGIGFVWFPEPEFDGGLEVLIEHVLAALDDAQVQLNDNTARVPISIGQQGVRSSVEPWSGAWLCLVNDGGAWKLDLAGTMHVGCRMTFQPGRRPATAAEETQVAVSFKNELAAAIDGIAAAIEEGKLKSASVAGRQVETDVAAVFAKFGLAGINYSVNPALPTSSEVAR